MPVKADATKQYLAFAPFEFKGRKYKEADVFTPPDHLKRDAAFEEFRSGGHKHPEKVVGITFMWEGEILDKTTQERNVYRVVLPVKEA